MYIWFPNKTSNSILKRQSDISGPNQIFDPNQPIDKTWNVESSETFLGRDQGVLFNSAVKQLMEFNLFPANILIQNASFKYENRIPRVGDLLIQQIRIIPYFLDYLSVSRITALIIEPQRRGFTITTTQKHLVVGEWTGTIVRRKDKSVFLLTHSIFKISRNVPVVFHPLAKFYVNKSLKILSGHFKKQVSNF